MQKPKCACSAASLQEGRAAPGGSEAHDPSAAASPQAPLPIANVLVESYRSPELHWLFKQLVEQLALVFESYWLQGEHRSNPLDGLGAVVDPDFRLIDGVLAGHGSSDSKVTPSTVDSFKNAATFSGSIWARTRSSGPSGIPSLRSSGVPRSVTTLARASAACAAAWA